MSIVLTTKDLPKKVGVADNGNSFNLGRRAFFNNTHKSYDVENKPYINSSTNSNKIHRLKTESGNAPKPLPNNDASLRLQRIRLTAIGSGSSRLKNKDDYVSFKQIEHNNEINTVLSRVRGSGGGKPKYWKKTEAAAPVRSTYLHVINNNVS